MNNGLRDLEDVKSLKWYKEEHMIQVQMRKNVLLILLALLCAISFWSRPAHAAQVEIGGVSATATFNPTTGGFDMQVDWEDDISPGNTILGHMIYLVPAGPEIYNFQSYHNVNQTMINGAARSWTSSSSIFNDSFSIGAGNPLIEGDYHVYVVASVINSGMPFTAISSSNTVHLSPIQPISATYNLALNNQPSLPQETVYAKVGDTVNLSFTLSRAPSAMPTVKLAAQTVNNVSSVGNNVYKASYQFDANSIEDSVQVEISAEGNTVAATSDNNSVIIFDRTAPTATTFNINNGDTVTNSRSVTLTIASVDNPTPRGVGARGTLAFGSAVPGTGPVRLASLDNSAWNIRGLLARSGVTSGLGEMRFSNDNANWSEWEPYSTSKQWELSDGDGVKTVYMELKDKAGNITTTPASANIQLELPVSIAPVNIKSSNDLTGYAKVGDTVTLTFSLSKPTSSALTATIADQDVTVTSVSYNVYNASYTLTNSDFEGRVWFSIRVGSNPPEASTSSTTDDTKVIFDKTAPTATVLTINSGAATTNTMAVTLTIEGQDNSRLVRAGKLLASADNSLYTWGPLAYSEPVGSGLGQMQFSNDGVNWSDWEPYATTKAWTLSYGNGTKTVYMKLKDKVGNEMTTPYTATIDLQQPFYSSSSGPSYTPSETITVNVENGVAPSGSVVSTATINRTTDANGRKTDAVTFTLDQANKTVDQLKAAGSDSARIVIPDPKDEVSEVNVTIPKASTDSLVKGNVGVEISTANGRVDIPKSSLEGFADDIYFRFVPIKTEDERKVVEDRAKKEQEVRLAVGNDNISIVGRPMTIETNLQSRPVTLVIPLGDTSSLTEQQLQNLGVFIEHSDGTKEFVKGQIVNYDDSGKLGIQFTVTKFSTFTVVKTDGLNKTTHKAYINGYPDGTFGPEKNITRAEMASLLARVSDKAATKSSIAYTDVASSHWAKDAIDQATKMGLMEGYNGGSFKPEQTITRAEMAAILSRISGNSASSGDSFNDVNGHWAQSAVAQAKAAGYIDGYADGTFRPEQTLTRAEAVTMINKLLGRGPLSGAASKWSDVPSGSWAFEQIQEASIDHTSEKNATGGEQWVTTP
ncbi:S-layer homology domain-containing protein [Paenibacillus thalictri]|uniref:S-layer homology domain-containing protein n=1 Tax=Paenibacillus thalictri TaxID=2527873 RepID=A0A4Q9DH02_9BACL|nr:S-layer homology domain-containing protein [Paenibacillus thalictri]TBL71074.1 S-layer homology domain-containing protein [Paenibacillus thalictri]